jgi:transcriptional regulator GlxA family with amidase domain
MPRHDTQSSSIDVLFVIVAHALLLDIAGPAEAFRLVNLRRAERNLPPKFRLRFAGPVAETRASVGLTLAGLEPLPRSLASPTWVVLPGQPAAEVRQVARPVIDTARWLKSTFEDKLGAHGTRHRLATICSGTLLAARAGLVNERHCTTHHDLLEELRRLAPRAHVVDNRVFVVDGPLASSAGITAGIDLALHMIAEECGETMAAAVAEDMVVYLRRSPNDPELSPFLAHRRHLHGAVHKVQNAMSAEPERNWTMAALAAVGHVTERHLLRLFLRNAGVSPLNYLRAIRLELARDSIERGASVSRAAEIAGFNSSLQLRRAWGRHWGGSPSDVEVTAARVFAGATLQSRLAADSA